MAKEYATPTRATRRNFLLGAGAASAATVGAVAAMAVAPATELASVAQDAQPVEKASGYQASAHVNHYYKTAAL